MKVVWIGAHYNDMIGYSKVAYEVLKRLAKVPDIELHHFGWRQHATFRRKPIEGCKDFVASSADPSTWKGSCGWGEDKLPKYLARVKPDIVIMYEEAKLLAQLYTTCIPKTRKYNVWLYLDQNYKYNIVGNLMSVDRIFVFSEQWRMPISVPQSVLLHAPSEFVKPVSKEEVQKVREDLKIAEDIPIFLSINRNTERKRLDLLIQSWAIYKRNGGKGHLILMTWLNGYYNLQALFNLENAPVESITLLESNISDERVNLLLNLADYGVNTSWGEGFGLMALEMAYLGKPQLAMDIGSYRSWLTDETAVLLKPTLRHWLKFNEGGGAFGETTTPELFAEGFTAVQTKSPPSVSFTWDSVCEEICRLCSPN
jgi:glycosyltransferase involved in cell wall biosynthesis